MLLEPKEVRRLIIRLASKRQRPGTGSSFEFLRRRTAMTKWPDLRNVLVDIRWATIGGVATRHYMPERVTADLDILIQAKDTPAARERLKRAGYQFDAAAMAKKIDQHRARSRAGAEKKFGGHGLAHGPDVRNLDPVKVWQITRLHTATHLLHAALRQILGPDVRQDGSDINPERLRFDFTFNRKLTDQEKQRVEELINEKVRADLPVRWEIMPYEQAMARGVLAFFKEKYSDQVKVYSIGDFSKELCGGPHVEHTAEVGRLKIVSEKSSSAGIRRIKAIVE